MAERRVAKRERDWWLRERERWVAKRERDGWLVERWVAMREI
jgi:hypothetical protein